MASPSPAPLRTPLQPNDWIAAAFARLAREGVESVWVEVLARDLGVSKGSFYWHFKDRDDLLVQMLDRWESREAEWLTSEEVAAPERGNPAARWARFVERSAEPDRMRAEVAVRAWARQDPRVALRIATVEKRKATVVADILRDIGFPAQTAELWAEITLFVYSGWLDRTTRDTEFQSVGRGLGEFLSELVLAASARTVAENR